MCMSRRLTAGVLVVTGRFLTWWPCAMVSIALVAHIIASRAGAPTIFSFFDEGEDEEADPDCMPKPRAYRS